MDGHLCTVVGATARRGTSSTGPRLSCSAAPVVQPSRIAEVHSLGRAPAATWSVGAANDLPPLVAACGGDRAAQPCCSAPAEAPQPPALIPAATVPFTCCLQTEQAGSCTLPYPDRFTEATSFVAQSEPQRAAAGLSTPQLTSARSPPAALPPTTCPLPTCLQAVGPCRRSPSCSSIPYTSRPQW